MKKKLTAILAAVVCCLIYTTPSHALVGASLHWGFDFTLDMGDVYDMPLSFDKFEPVDFFDDIQAKIDSFEDSLPGNMTVQALKDSITNSTAVANTLPLMLSRSGFTRSPINFGGKVFIDEIPVIDAVEVSFNIGAWEYLASLKYPNGQIKENITKDNINAFLKSGNYENILQMDEVDLTLDNMGLSYLKLFGISKTPYTKFQIDISIRKNIIAKPDKTKLFKLYLGAGPSLHMGTPIITPDFIEDVIQSSLEAAGTDFYKLGDIGDQNDVMEMVVEELKDAQKNPTFGMHILAGIMVKIPVIPLGFYFDSKLMIPFSDMDDNVKLDGLGFLLNGGIALAI